MVRRQTWQARRFEIFESARHFRIESNRDVRFEYESKVEASQVPRWYLVCAKGISGPWRTRQSSYAANIHICIRLVVPRMLRLLITKKSTSYRCGSWSVQISKLAAYNNDFYLVFSTHKTRIHLTSERWYVLMFSDYSFSELKYKTYRYRARCHTPISAWLDTEGDRPRPTGVHISIRGTSTSRSNGAQTASEIIEFASARRTTH